MIQPIMKDEFFLRQKSSPAIIADKQTAQDLLDTLKFHQKECVGMAANMIGVKKNIIAIQFGPIYMIMFNPKIIQKAHSYETVEGCLSLSGTKKTIRYKEITVEYQDMNFKKHRQVFTDWTAQIIQHECDHLAGILI